MIEAEDIWYVASFYEFRFCVYGGSGNNRIYEHNLTYEQALARATALMFEHGGTITDLTKKEQQS